MQWGVLERRVRILSWWPNSKKCPNDKFLFSLHCINLHMPLIACICCMLFAFVFFLHGTRVSLFQAYVRHWHQTSNYLGWSVNISTVATVYAILILFEDIFFNYLFSALILIPAWLFLIKIYGFIDMFHLIAVVWTVFFLLRTCMFVWLFGIAYVFTNTFSADSFKTCLFITCP